MASAWQHFTAEALASATECPVENVRTNWPRLVEQLELCGINERLVQIGMAGTVAKESASSFMPVKEAFFLGEPAAENHRRTLAYYPFFGRGYIQLTHRGNYERYGHKVAELWRADPSHPDFDLVGNPDRALDPTISAAVSALFFRDTKTLQGYGIVDACRARDWEWVRRLVLGAADPDGVARIVRIEAALSGGAPVPTPLPFNPDAPIDVQPNGWGCALESTQWLLRSIGRNPDANDTVNDPWLRSQLVPGIISEQNGLNNADGKALAAWITETYGVEMGFTAHAADVTFDDVLAGAGINPTLIGGRRWGPGGHWAGVRRSDEHGWLELANPSPGYTGVGTHLDRAEWDARGPWTAIYIDRGAAVVPAPEPEPEPQPSRASVLISEIRLRLDELEQIAS